MHYEETVQLSHLDRRTRARIKTPGYAKGPVRIVWRDDAVVGATPLYEEHENSCELWHELNVRNRRSWHSADQDHNSRASINRPHVLGDRCTCKHHTMGFYATQLVEPRAWTYGIHGISFSRELPTVFRLAPRPFSVFDALRYSELERQLALVLADDLMSEGRSLGEQIVLAVRKMPRSLATARPG
jgi:hypothetical protein